MKKVVVATFTLCKSPVIVDVLVPVGFKGDDFYIM